MKKVLFICVVTVVLASCGVSASRSRNLIYQNIVILSDLSSRIRNKPSKDIDEINKIVRYFRNECVKPGEKIGDKSCISFSAFSGKVVASIDIGRIKKLGEKQQFINSTGKYLNSGLDYQIENFEANVRSTYARDRNDGLDLISALIEKIENEPIIKTNTYLTDGLDTTFLDYENHVYIFTDGYLEYLNKNENGQFYFGSAEIDKVRQFCKRNNVNIARALEMNSSLTLPSIRNSRNKYIHLHIMETHERDKDERLQTYKNPKGQRDNEILEAVWRKWAKESGFRSFDWRKY